MYFLTLKDQFQTTWPQVRSRSGHDPRRSIRISSEASWRDKSFGTICPSLSPFCRELLAKNGLGDEENFRPPVPAPSFLKINFVACDHLLTITPKKPTLAFWLREKVWVWHTLVVKFGVWVIHQLTSCAFYAFYEWDKSALALMRNFFLYLGTHLMYYAEIWRVVRLIYYVFYTGHG